MDLLAPRAETSKPETTGSTRGKSGNVAIHMMSSSFLNAGLVWPACPSITRDTRVRLASADGANPLPLGIALGNRDRTSRCCDTTRNRQHISPRKQEAKSLVLKRKPRPKRPIGYRLFAPRSLAGNKGLRRNPSGSRMQPRLPQVRELPPPAAEASRLKLFDSVANFHENLGPQTRPRTRLGSPGQAYLEQLLPKPRESKLLDELRYWPSG